MVADLDVVFAGPEKYPVQRLRDARLRILGETFPVPSQKFDEFDQDPSGVPGKWGNHLIQFQKHGIIKMGLW